MTDAVAILPARGGSKRIPKKNHRLFAGRPAIGWPLDAARTSGCFSRIVVSTDDREIAKVAAEYGAEIPFMRDAALADDYAGTTEVIQDTVERLDLSDETLVCCIYSTAFFVTPDDLKAGKERMNGANWVLALGAYRTPIERAYRLSGDNGQVSAEQPAMMPKRSQDLAPAFFDAGQFYWARAATWRNPDARVWDGAAGVVLPPERTMDIDTPADWELAERMFDLLGLGTDAPAVQN